MSSGKRVKLSFLESFAGYAGRVDMLAGGGGMVDCVWVSFLLFQHAWDLFIEFEWKSQKVVVRFEKHMILRECVSGRIRNRKLTAGFGEVKAKTRAVATASAYVLNSATGVMFPSTSTAPPITTTSLTLRKASGSSAAANAKFVRGPTAMMVMVSTGFSRSNLRISK